MSSRNPSATPADTRKIRNLTEELSREEHGLGIPLLDAAVAGVILGFKPSDREMRTQAQRCWETLKPRLNQHLLSEDETVLPWAQVAGGISAEQMERIKQSHLEMRSLIAQAGRSVVRKGSGQSRHCRRQGAVHVGGEARRFDRQRGNAPAAGA